LLSALFAGVALLAIGCGPTYPKCENDEHCEEKGEFCVNKLCQECRDSSHCSKKGAGYACSAGKCQRKIGYCDPNLPCSGRQVCRDNECGAECLGNADCQGNTYCSGGSCIQKPECGQGADNPNCPDGSECVAGSCEKKVVRCGEAIFFSFDRYNILRSQRDKLNGVAECMMDPNAGELVIEGHCDERGSEAYNLALGERRANTVSRYLRNKGIKRGRLETRSWGEERPAAHGSGERSWSQNRRAEFVPR